MFKKVQPMQTIRATYEEIYYQDAELAEAINPYFDDGETMEFQIGNKCYSIRKGDVSYE